jgi:hypothetical protein
MAFGKYLKLGRLTSFARFIWFNQLLRQIYKSLPLPWHFKQQLKDIYLGRSGVRSALTRNTFQLDRNPDALPSLAVSARQYNRACPWILVVSSSVLSTDEDNNTHPMLGVLHLLREMGFHITFVPDSRELLCEETTEKQGIHFLHGFDAIPSHLMAEGGKYHYVLLCGPETAFRHLPYVRAYAPYSRVIYWMGNLRSANHSAYSASADNVTEPRRFELFNIACADLVLTTNDEEKNKLFARQPETKVAVLPNLAVHPSDNRARKYWADIFADRQTAP